MFLHILSADFGLPQELWYLSGGVGPILGRHIPDVVELCFHTGVIECYAGLEYSELLPCNKWIQCVYTMSLGSMPKYSSHLFKYLITNWQHWMLKWTSGYEHGFALACIKVEVVYRYPFRYGICRAFDSPELFQCVCTITYHQYNLAAVREWGWSDFINGTNVAPAPILGELQRWLAMIQR